MDLEPTTTTETESDFIPARISGMEIIKEAHRYLGVRFKHQGESFEGIDCSGLICAVGKGCRQIPQDLKRPAYSLRPDPRLFLLMRRWGVEIPVGEEQLGDVLLMSQREPGKIQHVSIRSLYQPDGRATIIHLHPSQSIRRVCEHSIDICWEKRILGVLRFKGVRG